MILPHRANPRGCDFRERHVIKLDVGITSKANLLYCQLERQTAAVTFELINPIRLDRIAVAAAPDR